MKNQIKKFLSLVLVAVMCLSTFAIGASAAETCAHTNKQYTETKKATCEEYGYDSYKCTDCGKDFVENIQKPLGHKLEQSGETIPAYCWREEATVWVCVNEGCDKKEERGELTGEQCEEFDEPTFTIIDGKLQGTMTCKDCGYVHTFECACGEEHPELEVTTGHSHEVEDMIADPTTIVKPTCTENGSIVYKCDDCKYTVTVVIEKTHQLTFHAGFDKKCDKDGEKAHYTCDLCGKYFVTDKDGKYVETTAEAIVIPAAHTLAPVDTDAEKDGVQYDYVREENCLLGQKAIYKVYCTVDGCEFTDKKEADELTHDFREDGKSYDSTCATWGDHVKVCALCGLDKSEAIPPKGFLIVDKTGTKDDVWATLAELLTNEEYIKLATKNEAECGGYASYTYKLFAKCSEEGCDYCKTGFVTVTYGEKREHTPVAAEDNAPLAPTCTVPGKEEHYICSNCGVDIEGKEGDVIDALGHEWSKDVLYCSVEDKAIQVCERCNCVDTLEDGTPRFLTAEELKELKFVKPEGTVHAIIVKSVIAPTCVKNGEKITYCAICHHEDEPEVLPATGHNYSEEATIIAGSCTEKTLYVYSCTNAGCDGKVPGHNKVVEGDYDKTAAGHMAAMVTAGNVADKKILRHATCTVRELAEYTCTQCKVTYTVTGNYGHDVVDKTVDPQCWLEKNGETGKWCNDCKKWVGETTAVPFAHNEDGVCAAQTVCGNEFGWAEFKYCTVCEEEEQKAKAAAEAELKEGEELVYVKSAKSLNSVKLTVQVKGHKTETTKYSLAATCTTYGVKEITYCAVCEKEAAEKAIAAAQTKAGKDTEWKGVKIQLDMLPHMTEAMREVEATADCVKDGFTLQYCDNCSEAIVINFDYANGHDFDEETKLDKNLDDKITNPNYDCTKDGYSYYACKVEGCDGEKEIEGTRVKAHHVDAKGNDFTSSCTSIKETTTCVHCGDVEVEHNYNTVDYKAPSCTEEGWEINICADCGERENTVREDGVVVKDGVVIIDSLETYLKKINEEEFPYTTIHAVLFNTETETWEYYVFDEEDREWYREDYNEDIAELVSDNEFEIVPEKSVAPTHTADGAFVFVCPCCEEEITVVLPELAGVEMEITAQNAVKPGAAIVNGGLVEFTVVLNAGELEASILKADFFYDADVLTFIGAEVEGIFNVTDEAGTLVIETNNSVTAPEAADGQVSVIVDASYTANKLPVNVTLDNNGIAFVTLTFRVAADAKGEAELFGVVSEVANVKGEMLVDFNVELIKEYFEFYEEAMALADVYAEAYANFVEAEERLEDALAIEGYDAVDEKKAYEAAEKALNKARDAMNDLTDAVEAWAEENELDEDEFMDMLQSFVLEALVSESFEIAKLGNINGDTSINTVDALAIRQMAFTNMDGTIATGEYFLTIEKLDENGDVVVDENDEAVMVDTEVNYLAEADINMDGIVGLDDYALLNQYLVGNITYEQLVLTSQVTE